MPDWLKTSKLLLLLAIFALAGCGADDDSTSESGSGNFAANDFAVTSRPMADLSGNTVVHGDEREIRLNARYQSCFNDGLILDGEFFFSLESEDEIAGFQVTFGYSGFSIHEPASGESLLVNGRIVTANGVLEEGGIYSRTRLENFSMAAAGEIPLRVERGYREYREASDGDYTQTLSMLAGDGGYDGYLRVTTISPLSGESDYPWPLAGVLSIEGADTGAGPGFVLLDAATADAETFLLSLTGAEAAGGSLETWESLRTARQQRWPLSW